MNLERGIETKGLRIRLILQSSDVAAHSAMSDEADRFGRFADEISDFARVKLRELVSEYPSLPRPR
jgi:hypothetical protein